MGITDGLFAGRSGIQSHGTAISVLADNISNANTVGFKPSRSDFVDILAGSLSSSGAAVAGSGSSVVENTQVFAQGSFEFTGRGLDFGIDGNGFFILQDQSTGIRSYTRAGNFSVDPDGNLLDQNGLRVLGFPANGSGGLEALNLNLQNQDTVNTTTVSIAGNLNSGATAIAATSIPAAADVPASTFATLNNLATFSTFVNVFDSLGQSHAVTVNFYKTADNTWTVAAYVDGSDVLGTATPTPANGRPFEIGRTAVDLDFATNGTAVNAANDLINVNAVPWSGGAAAGTFTINLTPFTQFSAPSTISTISQDGSGAGSLVSFRVEADGTILGQLDNGQTTNIGTVALANFANPEGLQRIGGSRWSQTTTSGEVVVGTPGTGKFGGLESGALELSTADIAADFIKLIQLQRGFQGSSRIITNIDDLLNEIINLA